MPNRTGSKALLLALLVSTATAAAGADGKLKGIMFGDYYAVLSADDDDVERPPEKRNAFQFRRIYLTYDRSIDDTFSTRYRLEAKDAGFGSGSNMEPFVKHAYLKWKKGLVGADLYLGLSGTPTFLIADKSWGYRPVEKTMLDLNKIGSSSDLGVALKGKSGKLGYHLMVGNGQGKKSEEDNGKMLYGSLSMEAVAGITVEGYADFNMLPADKNQLTIKGLVAVNKEGFRGGIEGFSRTNRGKGAAGADETITGLSLFGTLPLSDSLKGFGRLDKVSNDATDTSDLLVIAGLDHSLSENIHLIPNLYIQMGCCDMPDGPDPNIQARLTFFYKY